MRKSAAPVGPTVADLRADAEEARQIASGVQADARARMNVVRARYSEARRFDYYVVVCFVSGAQRLAFLEGTGFGDHRFVDGIDLAKRFGVPLPETPFFEDPPPRDKWAELTVRADVPAAPCSGSERSAVDSAAADLGTDQPHQPHHLHQP